MSERIQDQRPVYMGTFVKQTRYLETKLSHLRDDLDKIMLTQSRMTKQLSEQSKNSRKIKIAIAFLSIATIAMLMLLFID